MLRRVWSKSDSPSFFVKGEKMRLELYTIDQNYIAYLEKIDKNVSHSTKQKEKRPFVGVLLMFDNKSFVAPLTSPKEKHQKMKNTIDFIKISETYGAINLNNMVPVDESLIFKINPKDITDKKYSELIRNQLNFLNVETNKKKIINSAKSLYEKYLKGLLPNNIRDRCVDFPLLCESLFTYLSSFR